MGFVISVDVVGIQACSMILAGIAVLLWFVRDQENKSGEPVDYRHMLTLSFPMMLTSSFVLIINWVDVLMIGSMMREEDVGLYSVAFRLASIAGLGLVSINTIAGPKFVQFYAKEDMPNFKRTVQHSTKLIMLVSLPILGVLTLFSTIILGFFGSEFVHAKTALTCLVFGQFVNSLCGSVGLVLQMTGGERVVMWIMIGTALLNVVLNLLLIPSWGIEGGATASMLSVSAWNIAMLVAVRVRLGFWAINIK
jgi:O-antigen/teichoic acid export membrane protein